VPFTLAHPAAVLPLRGRGLPMPAMVAGAMVPDVPQLLGLPASRSSTHSLLGVVTVDLVAGVFLVLLWHVVLRRPLVDLAPDPWRGRLPEVVPLTPGMLVLSAPAVLVGSLTHVLWDAFTHDDTWATDHVAALRADLLGVPVYTWAQHLTSLLGLAVVAVAVRRHLAGLHEQPPKGPPVVGRWSLVVALAGGGLLGCGIAGLVAPWGFEAVVYYGAVSTVLVAGLGLAWLCTWWHLKRALRARVRG